jgi:transposase
VAETYEAGASVSEVARRHNVNANLLFTWRRTMGVGGLARADGPTSFVPAVIGAPLAVAALARSSAGAMEIVLAGGDRVIVDRTVDAAALASVIEIVARRRSVTTPR